ncbi:MAG: hypothetical protein Q9222_007391 [Ikaeria aurantiellina]
MLDRLWALLFTSRFYRLSTFETIWTVITYAIIEPTYTYVFAHNPQWRLAVQKDKKQVHALPKMKRPTKRVAEGLTYVLPLLLMDLTMIKKFAGVEVHDMAKTGNYALDSIGISGNYLKPSLHRFTWDSPLQTERALPTSAPSSRMIVAQLFLSITMFDQMFFLFHLALHKVPYLNKLHSIHHGHKEINPQITNQLDIVERLGLVMLANFSLNSINAHVLTRTIYIPFFVGLLVDIHSGLDLPWGYDKILPTGWASGSKRHSEHHENGKKYYEPFFTIWDDFLNLQGPQIWRDLKSLFKG